MDFQNRAGGKTGGGGVASFSESNRDRRERLRQLALETIDLNKDPYFMKNHLGSYECKLCLTLHNNEGSYLAHTQGKKHQQNLARRAAKEALEKEQLNQGQLPAPAKPRVKVKKFVKIGRPGYKVTKQRDNKSDQHSLLFQIDYPEIVPEVNPKHRFMSAYEQRIEPPDKKWQYLLFAAEPYETIAFKIPSREVDKGERKMWTQWNPQTKQFFLQFYFKESIKEARMALKAEQTRLRTKPKADPPSVALGVPTTGRSGLSRMPPPGPPGQPPPGPPQARPPPLMGNRPPAPVGGPPPPGPPLNGPGKLGPPGGPPIKLGPPGTRMSGPLRLPNMVSLGAPSRSVGIGPPGVPLGGGHPSRMGPPGVSQQGGLNGVRSPALPGMSQPNQMPEFPPRN